METNTTASSGTKPRAPAVVLAAAVAATGLMALTAACEDEEQPAQPAAPQRAERTEDAADAAEADKLRGQSLSYTYDALDRRDPFKTYFDELAGLDPQDRNLTDLQKIDLDKLTLVAVVVGTATPMAMVEDPQGVGHTVMIGTLIGKRLGHVKHIRRGEIVVQEEFRDFTGKRIPQLKEMKLEEALTQSLSRP